MLRLQVLQRKQRLLSRVPLCRAEALSVRERDRLRRACIRGRLYCVQRPGVLAECAKRCSCLVSELVLGRFYRNGLLVRHEEVAVVDLVLLGAAVGRSELACVSALLVKRLHLLGSWLRGGRRGGGVFRRRVVVHVLRQAAALRLLQACNDSEEIVERA